jgi:hypothetical protein
VTIKAATPVQAGAAPLGNDVWGVGAQNTSSTGAAEPLIEHGDVATWSVVSAPGGAGVTALCDGTVVVVSVDSILES